MTVRRIAAHLLWTPRGVVRHPLAEIVPDGRVRLVASCPEPDRLPFVEFRAGLLVPDFPADFREAFARLQTRPEVPLTAALQAVVTPCGGVPVVISGLDYDTLKLTPAARIEKI